MDTIQDVSGKTLQNYTKKMLLLSKKNMGICLWSLPYSNVHPSTSPPFDKLAKGVKQGDNSVSW